jgi:hypothetical protein
MTIQPENDYPAMPEQPVTASQAVQAVKPLEIMPCDSLFDDGTCSVIDANGVLLCDCLSQEKAREIVRRYNVHDRLVAALWELMENNWEDGQRTAPSYSAIERAKTLLAEIKEGGK